MTTSKKAYNEQHVALHHAGAAAYRADRISEHGGRAGRRRPHQDRHELCRHRHRTRPQRQGHRSRHGVEGADGRSRRRRCRLRAQRGRSQRAGAGAVRRRARHRAQNRAASRQSLADATPQLRNQIALDRAKTHVHDLHDKIEDDRAGGATLEQAAQKEKLPLVTFNVDRSGRDPDGKPSPTCLTPPTSSTPPSPPTSASTTIRSTPTAAMSGTTSPRSRRRATARSMRSRIRSRSAGATTRSPRG